MFRLGVLASTRGTDLQAIIDEINAGEMPGIEIAIVVSNKKNAYVLERAKEHNIEAIHLDPKNRSKEEYDQKLVKIFREKNVDLVCLIGYMKILTPVFVNAFKNKIINVHPALMPKYSGPGFFGANVHEQVLKNKESETGATIHIVDEGVDTGPILMQKSVTVDKNDNAESLKNKVQALEKEMYPEVIRMFKSGKNPDQN
ncbi:phosphoribosylglycinamide formyltransferase [Candidatus Peregrinibacteria bacterium]|nr:phosphoribosylglycinamide formyltransferase [Candidatus Peregrinibacteria bacterium]